MGLPWEEVACPSLGKLPDGQGFLELLWSSTSREAERLLETWHGLGAGITYEKRKNKNPE